MTKPKSMSKHRIICSYTLSCIQPSIEELGAILCCLHGAALHWPLHCTYHGIQRSELYCTAWYRAMPCCLCLSLLTCDAVRHSRKLQPGICSLDEVVAFLCIKTGMQAASWAAVSLASVSLAALQPHWHGPLSMSSITGDVS